MEKTGLSVAIIGGGVAGIVSAWLLQRRHQVTLFERNDYVGGHTNTVTIPEGPDAGTPVDTGFIVLNDRTYPLLHRFLAGLDVPVRDADMSFGFACELTGLQYAGTTLNGLFAQRLNLVSPRMHRMIADIVRFNRRARSDLESGSVADLTLAEYLGRIGLGDAFRDYYLLPMGAAIWSTSAHRMLEFPAESFLRFFLNHGLLSLTDRPQWQTVVGGSQSYVRAFLKSFRGQVRTGTRLHGVRREDDGAIVMHEDGGSERFDRVVIATHADEALALLRDPSDEERRLLGAWEYARNPTVLHTDVSFLPANRRAWASWNYRREAQAGSHVPLSVTYHMNRLQGLRTARQYCVTLNSQRAFAEGSVIASFPYKHPQYTFRSLATQAELPRLNGQRSTYFAGSYFGYGFHEDAVRSGAEVGRLFGEEL